MKHIYMALSASLFLFIGCQGQKNDTTAKSEKSKIAEEPKGSWKVNREFDEAGNLIRYDSIYSWSSAAADNKNNFSTMNRDSIFQSFRSQFSRNFSGVDDMMGNGLFDQDSLFIKRFFADDFFESEFGQDFMDLDQMHQHMQSMQKQFLQRYHKQFPKEKEKKENKEKT